MIYKWISFLTNKTDKVDLVNLFLTKKCVTAYFYHTEIFVV